MDTDILGHDTIREHADSWQSCSSRCKNDSKCKAWTWATEEYNGTVAKKQCLFKDAYVPSNTSDLISGKSDCY